MFRGCSRAELASLAGLLTAVHVPAGRVLTREGQPGRDFVIIEEGIASVRRAGELVATLGPGDFFGEASLLAATPRNATVEAVTDMDIAVLSPQEFAALLERSPHVAHRIMKTAVTRLLPAA
jgi:CRP-like cAMP-binding protein